MDRQKLKETLKVSGKTIGISLLVYAAILIFRPGYLGIMLLVTGLIIILQARTLYNNYRKRRTYIGLAKALAHTYIIVTIIYLLSKFLGPYGFWGSLLIVFLIATYKIIRHWQQFINGLRDIETSIWGRPLDRKNWQDRKLPKVRLVLNRRKGENMTKKKIKTKFRVRTIPPVLCWISLLAFIIIGGMALTENIITALVGLHAGVGVEFFIGYLFALLIIVVIAYLLPIVMIARYIRHARRNYKK